MALVVVLIFVYNIGLSYVAPNVPKIESDVMNRRVFNLNVFNSSCCSWWPISHFLFFMVLGFLFPSCDIPVISAGILWEIAEEILSIILNYRETRHVVTVETGNLQYRDSWWAGSLQDIFFNIAGFYFGKIISTMLFNRSCSQ